MANFKPPMSLENPYTFIDPFQPSINFSLGNLITSRREQRTIDDIPVPPPPPPPPNRPYVHMQPPNPGSVPPISRRSSGSFYYSPASKTTSEKSNSPPASSSSSRNTFGMEATGARKNRSKPRGSTSSSHRHRCDRESLHYEPADQSSQLLQAPSIGGSTNHDIKIPHVSIAPTLGSASGQGGHRKNLPSDRKHHSKAKSSKDPQNIHDSSRYVEPISSNAISYYKPPTRSSEIVLPSSSPYLTTYLPIDPTHPINPEYPIPFTTTTHHHPVSQPPPPPPPSSLIPHDYPSPNLTTCILAFLLDTLPRQIYLHLLLRLPHLYFTHVVHIFEDAEMSMAEIKQMALEANNYLTNISKTLYLESSPRYDHLSRAWGAFIDSSMREWKTLSIISVLLLSAILTILQIQSAANDPVTRFAAFLSMICALMSLLYGCIYVIRFSTMRSTCKAAEWAHEAQKTTTGIFWNVWVLLAMPATWLAWSMIFFVISIMAFVWRTGTVDDARQTPITSDDALVPRIIVTIVLSLGLIYLVLIRSTFRRYGTAMDRAWRTRAFAWMHETFHNNAYTHFDPRFQESLPPNFKHTPQPHSSQYYSQNVPPSSSSSSPPIPPIAVPSSSSAAAAQAFVVIHKERSSRGRSTSIKPIFSAVAVENPHGGHLPPSSSSRKRVIKPTKLLSLCSDDHSANNNNTNNVMMMIPSKETLACCQMTKDDWDRLSSELYSTWDPNNNNNHNNHSSSTIQNILRHWNQTFFNNRGAQIVLCEEFGGGGGGGGGGIPWFKHAIYHFSWKDELPNIKDPYDSIPADLTRLDIFYSLSNGGGGAAASAAAGLGKLSLFSSRLDTSSDLRT